MKVINKKCSYSVVKVVHNKCITVSKIDQTKQEIVAFFEPAPIEGHRCFFFDSFSLEMNSALLLRSFIPCQ